MTASWREEFIGGDAAAERVVLERLAREIAFVQRRNRTRQGDGVTRRAFHAKTIAGIAKAEFRVSTAISSDLVRGVLEPGAVHECVVRFSNASGLIRPDDKGDLRGVAIRVRPRDAAPQDFLLTNAPASHARDGPQFMAVAKAAAAGPPPLTLARLLLSVGPRETVRVLRAVRGASRRIVLSVATERYWSRAPFAIGTVAVRFRLEPVAAAPAVAQAGDDHLRRELEERLRAAPVRFSFEAQRFVDEHRTPIEDGTVEWLEQDAPFEQIAELFLPQQDLGNEESRASETAVEVLAFDPWLRADEIRPVGSLNRARKVVYEASARHRLLARDG